jgi:hypothetical protein
MIDHIEFNQKDFENQNHDFGTKRKLEKAQQC